jgi:hypothetical protein
MTTTELQVLRENRIEGENLNTTKERLGKERKLVPVVSQTALVPQKPAEPIVSETAMSDEDGFYTSDLMIPRWKAVQPTSRIEGAQEGRFYNSLTGELREKLENIVFLTRSNGRVLFPKDDFSGVRLCWSNDGMKPAADSVLLQTGDQPKSHACLVRNNGDKKVVCPFAQWQKTEKGNTVPECHETISFLGLDMQSLTPFFMIFHGTGIPPVKNFISSVYLKKKQATMHSQELHLRDFKVTLSLKLEMNDKGKFYYPVFEKIEAITTETDRTVLNNCFAALSKKDIEPPHSANEA